MTPALGDLVLPSVLQGHSTHVYTHIYRSTNVHIKNTVNLIKTPNDGS